MVLQLEDCADCLRALYPNIKFVFILDHTCGHDKQKEDGLNAANMGKSFVGTRAKLQDTHIKEEMGYLGSFSATFKAGNVQHMTFDPTDNGPFWMDVRTWVKTRRDVILSRTQKKRMFRKDELQQMLITKGLTMKGKLKDLQAAAQLNGIPIEEVKEKVIEGWENKAKGLLQVLWGRGWIDAQVNKPYHYHTINGKKDVFGNLQMETSPRRLMENCVDFQEEETMLQAMAHQMGVEVDRSPKSGEGIEYAWGCTKNYYRRLLLKKKRQR
jgi:hypothetical protein